MRNNGQAFNPGNQEKSGSTYGYCAGSAPRSSCLSFRTSRSFEFSQGNDFLGGSNGAGVPFPMNTKVNTHQSAIAVPIVTMTIPATCDAPVFTGATMPDHDRNRAGR